MLELRPASISTPAIIFIMAVPSGLGSTMTYNVYQSSPRDWCGGPRIVNRGYSYLSVFAGFVFAALMIWKLIVSNAMKRMTNAGTRKRNHSSDMRYG